MAAWPDTLPAPTIDGGGITPDDPVARSGPNEGLQVARERYKTIGVEIAVRWIFTEAQLAIFESWWYHTALAGAAAFDIDLVDGSGSATWSARFAGAWRLVTDGGVGYAVSAKLWARTRPAVA